VGRIGLVERAAVVETHISVLFFIGDRVYKVRKPVTTPFLDFSTRELRLADCRAEVQLNRRLAPDVYLGVHDVVDEAGAPVEHMVVMRRLPADRRLATMVADPAFDEAHLAAVARSVAAFHSRAGRAPAIDLAGSVEHLSMLWSTNLEETAAFTGRILDGDLLDRIGRQALDYLAGRHPLLAHRVTERRIVDGHGDLLAEDIFCLDDGPRILDCVEFDPRFRWGDVLYDTSFLAMDLEHLGRADLARRFLAAYREFAGETHPDSLEHWYIAYRALVRAKIACLRADGGETGAAGEAAAFLAQAGRHLDEAEIHLVLVGGLPGTGKTTLAQGLADRLGWAMLRSDEVRKGLAGLDHAEPATAAPFEGIYTPAFTAEVYRELLRRAEVALSWGDSVVLDATWLDPDQRDAAHRLAARCHAHLHELRCDLPVDQARDRIRARAASGGDASDATPEVLAALAQHPAPWPGAHGLDTTRPPIEAITAAVGLVRPDLAQAAAAS
jgi:aminoglycoside phosphotransferase family enzyme/predicted kinase